MRKRLGSFHIHALLWGIVALVVVTGVARQVLNGSVGPSSKTRLAFWNGFTGPDGIVMLRMIEDFNRKNPDVQVVMQRIPWATYYNKLTVAGSDGRGPEVFIVHADAMPRIRRAGFLGDLSPLYGPGMLDPADFDPYVVQQMDFAGKKLGVPLDVHPQGLYVNKAMMRAAGYKHPPRDKAEFLDLLAKTTIEEGPNTPQKQWGFAFTYWGANFRSLVPQFGGRYTDPQGNAVLNSAENVRALEFLETIAREKKAPPADNGLGWFGFRTQRVAMVWDGVFMLGDLMRLNDLEYVGAPVPKIGPKPGAFGNSHVLCVKRALNPKQQDAATRFIAYLSDHSLEWAAAGQVPARKSIRSLPEFQKLQVQAAFAEQVPHVLFPPRTPVIFEFMLEMDRAVERVVRGQAKPKQALDEANKNAQAVIDRDRREHPEVLP